MDRFVIYVDENAMDTEVIAALRSRGVTVTTVLGVGRLEKADEDQLAYAAARGCVLYSFNVGDFLQLHGEWAASGRDHAGMILAQQQRYSVGEQLRRLLRIREALSATDMRNRVEFLNNWG